MHKVLLLVVLFLLMTVTPVFAEDNAQSMQDLQSKYKEQRAQLLNDRKDFINKEQMTRKELSASREAEFKLRLASERVKFATDHAKLREEFLKKIAEFKDKNRATLAVRINENLAKINTNATDNMADKLDRMSTVSGKVATKIASASAAGKDTASASAALNNANAAIATAKSAVTTQAGKSYVVTITSESTVGQEIRVQKEKLLTDLKATRQTVLAAKMALVNAVRIVESLN